MKLEYKTYIFDLYGTLIDIHSDEHSARTWKKWCRYLDGLKIKHPHYINFRRDFFDRDRAYRRRAIEEGPYAVPEIDIIEVYRELFLEYENGILSDEILNEISYRFRECSRDSIELYPCVLEYLKMLRDNGAKLYLLSNAQASYTLPEINMFHLENYLDGIMISSDEKCMKPEKAFFDKLFAKYNIDKAGAVMVGDTVSSDIEGARRAGIASIHLHGENCAEHYYAKACSGNNGK